MQKLLLVNHLLSLKPLYGPFHRDILNLSWLLESVKSSMRTGCFLFQRLGEPFLLPVLEGKAFGEIAEDFELVTFYPTTENFLIHAFGLHERYRLPLYSDKPLWVNLESINFNTREFFKKIIDFETTGYMAVENRVKLEKAYLILYRGGIFWISYRGQEGKEALKSLLEDLSEEVCTIRVYELPEEIISLMLSNLELVGVYKDISSFPLESVNLVVSVSPQKYGYEVYLEKEKVFYYGFEEGAPFYELFVVRSMHTLEPLDVFSLLEKGHSLKVVKHDPNNPVLYFCPACWNVIGREDKVCPNCGYSLEEFHNLPYEYKLIMALEHPVKEMKRNVVYTIGRKDLEIALPHFEVMISRETDPIVLMEIVDALSRMSSPKAFELLRSLAQHPYPVVRSRAVMHLQRRLHAFEP
ncbi:MAG: HEAT repeat domain-containing protein [Aquificaceae bacterium]